MGIKNLKKRLPEVGKIKIGAKGDLMTSRKGKEFRPPIKFEHFVITSKERDKDTNLIVNNEAMELLGGKPKELRIMFFFDDTDINFETSYQMFDGKKMRCKGDGEKATWFNDDGTTKDGKCDPDTCKFAQPDKDGKRLCKISGILRCMLIDYPVLGGFYTFRTHGFYSVTNILNSLNFIKQCTNGILKNIPLKMRYDKQNTEKHGNVPAVVIFFDKEMNDLRQLAASEINNRKMIGFDMKSEERLAVESGFLIDSDTEQDVAEEYYPVDNTESTKENGTSPDDLKAKLQDKKDRADKKDKAPDNKKKQAETVQPEVNNVAGTGDVVEDEVVKDTGKRAEDLF